MTTAVDHRYPAIQGEYEDEAEYEFEFEAEAENEGEDEDFVNPIRRIYPDAELMAHLSRRASDAESEEEAEAFIGALIPIAARLIPRAASILARNAPTLIRGAAGLTRRLRANPSTRRLVRALPVVLQRTAQSLADQSAAGRPVTAQRALRTLATMTGRVLQTPASRRRAVRAVNVFDRRWHQRCRTSGSLAGGPAYGVPASDPGGYDGSVYGAASYNGSGGGGASYTGRRPVRRRQRRSSAAVRRGGRRR
jgi:hypothetical protein